MEKRSLEHDAAVLRHQAEGRKPWYRPELTVSSVEDVTRNSDQNLHDDTNSHS